MDHILLLTAWGNDFEMKFLGAAFEGVDRILPYNYSPLAPGCDDLPVSPCIPWSEASTKFPNPIQLSVIAGIS